MLNAPDRRSRSFAVAVLLASAVLAAACTSSNGAEKTGSVDAGLAKIKHLIFVMQENRSFDHYFGTYPGAEGIPRDASGTPTVACNPDPDTGACLLPYHDPSDKNIGGPHRREDHYKDVKGGQMTGFVTQAREGRKVECKTAEDPACAQAGSPDDPIDVMGWHDAREIPNYWTYAQQFVLHDHMFEPVASWSEPSHLWMVSGWSAVCQKKKKPMSCQNEPQLTMVVDPKVAPGRQVPGNRGGNTTTYPPLIGPLYEWTDITYLLHKHNVSWGYYVHPGATPDCDDGEMSCVRTPQGGTPNIWNPLPYFRSVRDNKQLANIKPTAKFFEAAATDTLPAVTWVIPDAQRSEHPASSTVSDGQAWVTSVVNAVMQGPSWKDSAIFVAWDDWGGFYDHVEPPKVDINGYGLRVPSLLISPYAKRGFIDKQALSFDAYLKLIEDRFLGGARLDPKTDGRPDRRPTVRENLPELGDLRKDFDFSQPPRAPVVLPERPPPGPASVNG